jgi:hypothetical protein
MTAILSGSSPADFSAVVPVIRESRITHHRLYVPLRRPPGGWCSKVRRREQAVEWLAFAALVVGSWAGLSGVAAAVDLVMK